MDKRINIWHDLAEKIVDKLLWEGTTFRFSHGRDELVEIVERTIKEFADKRIARIYFISGEEEAL